LSPTRDPCPSGELCGTGARRPKLLVQLSSLTSEARRVPIRQRPGDRRERHPTQKRLPVVGLDRCVALVAGKPVSCGWIAPPGSRAAAEVAGHGMTVSDRTCVRLWPRGDPLAALRGRRVAADAAYRLPLRLRLRRDEHRRSRVGLHSNRSGIAPQRSPRGCSPVAAACDSRRVPRGPASYLTVRVPVIPCCLCESKGQ
jgi:hypothetical protein